MYENSFNKIEKYPRAEEGIANELDYVEQKSRVLFLKYLHDLETERRDRAELDSEDYTPIISGDYRRDSGRHHNHGKSVGSWPPMRLMQKCRRSHPSLTKIF